MCRIHNASIVVSSECSTYGTRVRLIMHLKLRVHEARPGSSEGTVITVTVQTGPGQGTVITVTAQTGPRHRAILLAAIIAPRFSTF
jgi:hypothetical protein